MLCHVLCTLFNPDNQLHLTISTNSTALNTLIVCCSTILTCLRCCQHRISMLCNRDYSYWPQSKWWQFLKSGCGFAKRLLFVSHVFELLLIYLYKSIKYKSKFAIRSAKLDYLKSLLSCAHQTPQFAATLWSEINDIFGCLRKQKLGFDSHLSSDDINHFFRTVVVSAHHKTADSYEAPQFSVEKDLFQFKPTDSSVVASLLTKLNIRKSTGPGDFFSTLFLQRVADCIPLTKHLL